MIDFKVNPSLSHNSMLNTTEKDAAYRQSDLEHNEALNKYVRPGMTPIEREAALELGKMDEKKLKKYWDDAEPRENLSPSSSFIENIQVVPSLNVARITIGGHTRTYPINDKMVGDMLTRPSIGKYYNDNVKRG